MSSSITLVTGATGFLGTHLVERLPPATTRLLVRRRSTSFDPAFEQVVGDVEDEASLRAAMAGVSRVYHLAGLVSRDPRDATRLMRVHVDGTRALLRAAVDAGVTRVVLASSSGTIAVSKDEDMIATESSPFATELVKGWPYYLSKIYQEKLALEVFAKEKLPIVILNPSLLLGPGDARGSSTEDVLKFLQRKIPIVPEGGINFVDARDVADTFVVAMEKGKPGERYLLGGPNWTMATFFGRLERLSKVPAPKLKLPSRWARRGASLLAGIAEWRGLRPTIDTISVEMAEHFWSFDSSRAKSELGFNPRDPQETLLDTVRYLRRHFLGEPETIDVRGKVDRRAT